MNRNAAQHFFANLIRGSKTLGRMAGPRRNPLDVPAELITNPYAPLPERMSKAKRKMVSDLREVYAYAMRERFMSKVLKDPELVAELVGPILGPLQEEQMLLVPLDCRVQATQPPLLVSKGDIDGTEAGPRLVMRMALMANAHSFFLAHNHPTGDPSPSPADKAVTKRLIQAGKILDCPINDHIIIGRAQGRFVYTSVRRTDPALWMS